MRLFLFIASLLSATEQLWAKEICCLGLPCYSNDPPFAHLPVPECPKDIDIKMTLFTRQDPIIGQTITRDTIPSSFKDNVLTMFVVHGWNPVIPTIQWMYTIKDAALKKGDFNVIVVTWRGAMLQLSADQTASNTRPVGGEIALVSNNTISKGKSSRALMYCVGHSFGAHACGQAGQQGQFGRITGLDPASPFFEDYDLSVGLNPSCADLVDNIHTNAQPLLGIALGSLRPIGHIDFYPNGGGTQPGCTITQGLLPVVTCNNQLEVCVDVDIACSHMRATGFFEESIRTPCFLSYSSCSNQTKIPDSCKESKDPVQSMGFNANEYPGRGIFYLQTRACAPYCCTQA